MNESTINDLIAGIARVKEKQKPDERDVLENSNLNDQKLSEEIKSLKSDRKLREKYADKIIKFLYFYGGIVSLIVFLHGFKKNTFFELPSEVLVTLVGSTAVAAIGLVGFVAKGLFSNK